jgi:hypothetical protein
MVESLLNHLKAHIPDFESKYERIIQFVTKLCVCTLRTIAIVRILSLCVTYVCMYPNVSFQLFQYD